MSAALLLGMYLGAMPADAPLLAQGASEAASAQEVKVPAEALPSGAPEGSSSSAFMRSRMEEYLDAERTESKLFVGMGALSVAGGAVALAASDEKFLRGASLPLMGVGLIQLVVGGTVWWRTEEQKGQLRSLILSEPARYVSEESARMERVNRNFELYRWTEIGLLTTGLAVGGTGIAFNKDFITGLGAGLALQSAVMLTLDYFAEQRGREYADQVRGFRF